MSENVILTSPGFRISEGSSWSKLQSVPFYLLETDMEKEEAWLIMSTGW